MPLRPLTQDDLDMMLEWRNAPDVRKNMYSSHIISPEEHQDWFKRMELDESARWFIYDNEHQQAEGVVYFTNYTPKSGIVFWGFYASPEAKRGVGTRMEIEALDHAFFELGVHKLNCEVLQSNPKVINLHKKFGFIEEGLFRDFHFDGEQYTNVVRLGMIRHDWPANKENVLQRMSAFQSERPSE